jgi:acetate kinase
MRPACTRAFCAPRVRIDECACSGARRTGRIRATCPSDLAAPFFNSLLRLLGVRVLVVNAGSSSLKLRVLGADDQLLADEEVEAPAGTFDDGSVLETLRRLPRPDAVGHRVVHGGPRFSGPVVLTDDVIAYLRSLKDLAPLHEPAAVHGIEVVGVALRDVPAVACFDTAFHAHLPAAASTYAIPREWRERHGLRRYGFHGLSHAYAARRAAEILGRPQSELKIVTCHLGAGASLAAVEGGRSVDTTMGFTPLEGLVMATRSGSVDPGLVLWLQSHGGLTEPAISDALEHRSGLAGLAGTGDMRQILGAVRAGDADASLALDVYVHRLRACIAAMAAAMGGLDALVFTGGVGENAAPVREAAAAGLGFLGIALDHRDPPPSPDSEIGAPGARVRTLVIRAREDLEIAAHVRDLLNGDGLSTRRRGQ